MGALRHLAACCLGLSAVFISPPLTGHAQTPAARNDAVLKPEAVDLCGFCGFCVDRCESIRTIN